mmetsp:Transcript_34610/g.80221  ORF Transcript_34610/g.80221 Transcript_34610/m.80221 type:complete len:245 (-) Transcript_34610:779-1513(-)
MKSPPPKKKEHRTEIYLPPTSCWVETFCTPLGTRRYFSDPMLPPPHIPLRHVGRVSPALRLALVELRVVKLDLAEDLVQPVLPRPRRIDTDRDLHISVSAALARIVLVVEAHLALARLEQHDLGVRANHTEARRDLTEAPEREGAPVEVCQAPPVSAVAPVDLLECAVLALDVRAVEHAAVCLVDRAQLDKEQLVQKIASVEERLDRAERLGLPLRLVDGRAHHLGPSVAERGELVRRPWCVVL